MAKVKALALALAQEAQVPDQSQGVPPEVARGMSAEIFCKGSAKGTIAVTGAHLLATTSKRAGAKGTIASSFMALLRVIPPGSLLLEATAAEDVPKRRRSPKTRRARTNLMGLLAANPKRKIKRVKRGCCAEPCLFA